MGFSHFWVVHYRCISPENTSKEKIHQFISRFMIWGCYNFKTNQQTPQENTELIRCCINLNRGAPIHRYLTALGTILKWRHLALPADNKQVICQKRKKESKQMHLLRAKNGSGNKSSCSFRRPVFFQWRKDRTASSAPLPLPPMSRMCAPMLWWPAGLSKLTEMNLPAEGWACSAVVLWGLRTGGLIY